MLFDAVDACLKQREVDSVAAAVDLMHNKLQPNS